MSVHVFLGQLLLVGCKLFLYQFIVRVNIVVMHAPHATRRQSSHGVTGSVRLAGRAPGQGQTVPLSRRSRPNVEVMWTWGPLRGR